MKTKIINKGSGYWLLVSDEESIVEDGQPLILMSISNYFNNGCYRIQDFRYSKIKKPNIFGDQYSDWHTLDIHDESLSAIEYLKSMPGFQFSNFESNQIENYYSWSDNDGVVFDGHDKPFDQQNKKYPSLIHPHWVWSYRLARKKMNEAKIFWKNFNGEWSESKILNKYLLPSGMMLRTKIRKQNEK